MISIHMTTAARYKNGMLQRAIDSVLSQSYRDFEFIICDDGSRDGTSEYLKALEKRDPRVSIVKNPENIHSVAVSLARCMKASSKNYPYICWMFDDNIMLPGALDCLIAAIESDATIDFVYGRTICHLKNGGQFIVGEHSKDYIREHIEHSSVLVPNAGLLVKRQLFDSVGWYDSNVLLRRSTDWDLFSRMIRAARFKILPDVLIEEYGDLEEDSLRNSYTTSLDIMKKYIRLRDATEWKLDIDAALYHPADRIPLGSETDSWSKEELHQLYFIMLEYYVSIRNWTKAGEWATALLSEMKPKRHWVKSLYDEVSEGRAEDRLQNLAALSGILYGVSDERDKRIELEQSLRNSAAAFLEQGASYEERLKEKDRLHELSVLEKDKNIETLKAELMHRDALIHRLHLSIEERDIELNSLRHRIVNKINSYLKSLPLIHRFLKELIRILTFPFKRLSRA